tara:strand:- start:1 stop:171 length:171 start_codon:yes stop_codon:yes gene_type:complete
MTFEILVSMYVGALLVYVPYVLTKVIRTRREHDRLRKEFIMKSNVRDSLTQQGEDQ